MLDRTQPLGISRSNTIGYLQVTSFAAVLVTVIFLTGHFFSLNNGLVLTSLELITSLCIVLLLSRKVYWRRGPTSLHFLVLYGLFLVGDFWYGYFYYVKQIGHPTQVSFILTEGPYTLAYLLLPLIYLRAIRRSTKAVLSNPFAIVPWLIIIPIIARFLSLIKLSASSGNAPPIHILESIALQLTFVGVILSFTVFIFSTKLFWSLFSLGMATALFASWAIRADRLSGLAIQFVSFECLWAFGLLVSGIAVVKCSNGNDTIEFRNQGSIVFVAKVMALVSAFAASLIVAITKWDDLGVVQWVTYSSLVSMFLAGVLGHYLWDKLAEYSVIMERLLTETLTEELHAPLQLSTVVPAEMLELHSRAIQRRLEDFKKSSETETKLLISKKIEAVTKQVAHDIRSPLSALRMMTEEIVNGPEKNRILIRSSINRINDIANQLLHKGKEGNEPITFISNQAPSLKLGELLFLSPLVESIISEKRVQYRKKQFIEIESEVAQAYGLFVLFNSVELNRIISNLVNNAVEAFQNGIGKVTASVIEREGKVLLIVSDNGKGIAKPILERLGTMGVTEGKSGPSGSGLGIFHAKKTVEEAGGLFNIQSQEGSGTTISITLKKAQPPKWFCPTLRLTSHMTVVSLDDEISFHQVWKQRFESLGAPSLKHLEFTSAKEFMLWCMSHPDLPQCDSERLYLIDYELLNQKITGLEVIDELGIAAKSLLVTSKYDEKIVIDRCEELGVRIIPKTMAGVVPIVF